MIILWPPYHSKSCKGRYKEEERTNLVYCSVDDCNDPFFRNIHSITDHYNTKGLNHGKNFSFKLKNKTH